MTRRTLPLLPFLLLVASASMAGGRDPVGPVAPTDMQECRDLANRWSVRVKQAWQANMACSDRILDLDLGPFERDERYSCKGECWPMEHACGSVFIQWEPCRGTAIAHECAVHNRQVSVRECEAAVRRHQKEASKNQDEERSELKKLESALGARDTALRDAGSSIRSGLNDAASRAHSDTTRFRSEASRKLSQAEERKRRAAELRSRTTRPIGPQAPTENETKLVASIRGLDEAKRSSSSGIDGRPTLIPLHVRAASEDPYASAKTVAWKSISFARKDSLLGSISRVRKSFVWGEFAGRASRILTGNGTKEDGIELSRFSAVRHPLFRAQISAVERGGDLTLSLVDRAMNPFDSGKKVTARDLDQWFGQVQIAYIPYGEEFVEFSYQVGSSYEEFKRLIH